MVRLAKLFSSTPHTNEKETKLHPTRWRLSKVHPHSDEQHHYFPLCASGFSPFSSPLTQPHLHPLRALHVPNPPRQNSPSRRWSPSHLQHLRSVAPTLPTKDFSQTHPLQYSIHLRSISLLPLKTDLVDPISISFPIYLSFPQSLPLSQFDRV